MATLITGLAFSAVCTTLVIGWEDSIGLYCHSRSEEMLVSSVPPTDLPCQLWMHLNSIFVQLVPRPTKTCSSHDNELRISQVLCIQVHICWKAEKTSAKVRTTCIASLFGDLWNTFILPGKGLLQVPPQHSKLAIFMPPLSRWQHNNAPVT